MIPTIIDWVCDLKVKECIKGRFNSESKEVVLPVLMCPDDCDLSCTVIVVNVIKADGYIIWKQVGIDMSTREDMLLGCDGIGSVPLNRWFALMKTKKLICFSKSNHCKYDDRKKRYTPYTIK